MKNIRVVKINIGSPTPQQTELRKESARLWNRLVKLHKYNRNRHWKWLGKFDLSSHFKGRFDLHSQSIQALCEKLSANVDTTRTNRKNGDHKARYPWRCKKNFQVCIWKQAAIHIKGNRISLSNGRGRKPLRFKLPRTMPMGKIVAGTLLPPSNVKYLRPVKLRQSVVDLLNRGKLLSTTHTKVTVSEETGSKIRCDYGTGFDLETHTL